MLVLRQSTSITIRMGPGMDATNGVTPVTTLTIASADQAEVLKADGAATVSMAGTLAPVTGCDGWYDYTCVAGDVDTVGEVAFVLQDESLALPVFRFATVVDTNTYDALYADTPTAFDASGQVTVGTNNDKTGYSLTQTFPSNFADLAITASTGRVDINSNNDKTGYSISGTKTTLDALNDISSADVNFEVSDVMKVDTAGEPAQGEPPLTASMQTKIQYLYTQMVRNKKVTDTNTENQHQVFADNGTTILYEYNLTNVSNVTTQEKAQTGA